MLCGGVCSIPYYDRSTYHPYLTVLSLSVTLHYTKQSYPGNQDYVNHCLGQCAAVMAKRSEEVRKICVEKWGGGRPSHPTHFRCYVACQSHVYIKFCSAPPRLYPPPPTNHTAQHILQQAPLDAECVEVIARLLTLPLASLALKVQHNTTHNAILSIPDTNTHMPTPLTHIHNPPPQQHHHNRSWSCSTSRPSSSSSPGGTARQWP